MPKPEIEVFYDGHCPLCAKEIAFLRRQNKKGRIGFIDIAAKDFDPTTTGLSWETLMARIHGRLPDGSIIEGVEVFRRLYTAIGWGPIVALTRLPGISQATDVAYRLFARNRLRLTGRCVDGACEVHRAQPH